MQTEKDMMLTVLTVGFLPHQDGPPKCIWSGIALIKPNCPANTVMTAEMLFLHQESRRDFTLKRKSEGPKIVAQHIKNVP